MENRKGSMRTRQDRKGTTCAEKLKIKRKKEALEEERRRRKTETKLQECMTGSKGLCNICQGLKWVLKAWRIHKHEKTPLLSKLTVTMFTAANQDTHIHS